MKENNTAEGTGFFLSPADIDRINKDKNTGNDEADWFSGVTNAGGGNAGGDAAFSPLDFAAKIITEDVSANDKKMKEASEPEEVEAEPEPDAAESVSAIESELITEKPESEPESDEGEEIEEEPESNAEPELITEKPEQVSESANDNVEEIEEESESNAEPELITEKPESVPAKTIIYEKSAIDAAISAQAKPKEAAANPADFAYGRAGGRSDSASSGNASAGNRAYKADTQAEIAAKQAESAKKAAEQKAAEEKAAAIAAKKAAEQKAAEERAAARAAKQAELAAKKAEEAEKRAAAKAARQAEIAAKKAEKAEWKEEKKRQRKAYKGEGPAHRAAAVLLGLLLVVSAVAALLYWIGITSFQKEYVAGNSNAVQVYIAAEDLEDGAGTIAAEENTDAKADTDAKTEADAESGEDKNAVKNADAEEAANAKADGKASDANGESEEKPATVTADSGEILVDAGTLVRGTEVSRYKISESLNGGKLCKIKINDPENPDADTSYYISEDNLTDDYENIVQESEVWVRTPATIYEREYGPSIASFAPKGTRLKVIGFDKLLDNGYINKYKVEYDPVDTKEKDTATGYVYGKYMAASKDEAEAPYNEHGETDKAKKEKFGFELYGGKGENLDWYPYEKTSIPGNEFCNNARAMYINTYAAVHPGSWIKIINKTDCNAVVIDLKDGPLTFAAETAKELSPTSYKNAYVSEEKLKEGIDKYRDAGVYLIGRIVVFNDKYYAKDHPEDCIKYGSDTSWPSAYSRDVWEYNIRLAQEAVEKFGFNEIQFDYVRFPETSYEMSKSGKADFRNKYDEEKAQAVQNFCFYACDQLRESGVYTSIDVFGESAYSYVTAYGQYWASISNIVDAISAMPYTDHFSGEEPWEHPYDSVKKWAKSAAKRQKRIQNPAAARTWITGYNTPYWKPTVNYGTKEMRAQIRALEDVGLKGGFIPWNAMSDLEKYNQYRTIWNEK